jgi:hypothetical protein
VCRNRGLTDIVDLPFPDENRIDVLQRGRRSLVHGHA